MRADDIPNHYPQPLEQYVMIRHIHSGNKDCGWYLKPWGAKCLLGNAVNVKLAQFVAGDCYESKEIGKYLVMLLGNNHLCIQAEAWCNDGLNNMDGYLRAHYKEFTVDREIFTHGIFCFLNFH